MAWSAVIALAVLSAAPIYAQDSGWEARSVLKRANTVTAASELANRSFDYVIVGGGTAGLVIANRLSANASVSVAVVEAGTDGSQVADDILAPAQAYFDGIASKGSPYDWSYSTVAQTNLADREIFWPRGKVLGGSSAVNGLYMIRASKIEHDSWASLNPGSASTWGWDAIFPYMKKSETFTAPTPANVELAGVVTDSSLHGAEGPIHYSYPGFFYPQVANWIPTLANLGIETRDPAGGESWGAFVATSAIDPDGWKRSYSKTGYLDPIATRSNLVVLTGHLATKINFEGTTATGVTFAATAGGTAYTVIANKEVILAGGVIGSPQLLQVSGVGPSDLLTPLGIEVVVDLPGVGMHLTDHLSGQISYSTSAEFTGDEVETNATYAAAQLALWKAGDPTSLYNSPNNAVYYGNLTTLFGEAGATDLIADLTRTQPAQVAAYSSNAEVRAGYDATYTAEVRDIYPSPVGQCEILLANTGTYGSYGVGVKTISIQAALQHPLSRGSVKVTSDSVFDAPLIDPGYLTHPADIQVLREAFKMARRIGETAPMSDILSAELTPGKAVSTDEEWDAWIRRSVSTEYHPAGSCSMLPREQGGVVDTAMKVYGLSNVRVIDSSIVPIGMSAHMTAPLYGIAEAAFAVMEAELAATSPSGASSSGSSSSTASSTASGIAASTSSRSEPSASAGGSSQGTSGAPGRATVAIASVVAAAAACLVLV